MAQSSKRTKNRVTPRRSARGMEPVAAIFGVTCIGPSWLRPPELRLSHYGGDCQTKSSRPRNPVEPKRRRGKNPPPASTTEPKKHLCIEMPAELLKSRRARFCHSVILLSRPATHADCAH